MSFNTGSLVGSIGESVSYFLPLIGSSASLVRKAIAAICVVLLVQLTLPGRAMSSPVVASARSASASARGTVRSSSVLAPPSSSTPLNLDLSSTAKSLSLQLLGLNKTVNISVGGVAQLVNGVTALTPAELVAASQVALSGRQTLSVAAGGNAVGGRFSLTGSLAQSIGNLVIPQHVKLIENFANLPTLNLSGNLTDAGKLIAFSTSSLVATAVINANNIYVQPGGLITSSLSSAGSHGLAGAIGSLHLNLTALNDIVNSGAIISSGNLSLSAGGSITNALPQGATGIALIKATNAVNLMAGSGSVINSGLISSTQSNVYFRAPLASDITIHNQGGTVSALAGSINVRDASFSANANALLDGGDWLSKELNLNSGQGTVTANLNQATGAVNVNAGQVHLSAATNDLILGNMNISGDPTFYNTSGSVTLSSTLNFAGQDLAIVAYQDIYTTGTASISTASATGNGGNIILIAGAGNASGGPFVTTGTSGSQVNNDSTSTITIQGPSSVGGAIDLTQSGGITAFTSASTAANGSGGIIRLIAYSGTGSGSPLSLTPGTINLPAGVTIDARGSGSGSDGNLLAIAGAGQAIPPLSPVVAINIGGINAHRATGGGGLVTIIAATPTLSGPNGYMSIINGSVIGPSDSFTLGNIWEGAINLNNNITASQLAVVTGGNITVFGSLTANSSVTLTTYGSGLIGGSGSVNSTGSIALRLGTTPVVLGSSAGNITITQAASTLTIASATAVSSLVVHAASSITTSADINVGFGSLTLDTTFLDPYSNSITLNNNLTANGGITLTVNGTATIGGTGTISSFGPIALNLGLDPATLSTVSGKITVGQGNSILTIATLPNLLDSLSITSSGNIQITNVVDVGFAELTLGVNGAATIGGAGSIKSNGIIILNLGTKDLTLSTSSNLIRVAQGSTILTIGTAPTAIELLEVNANGGNINVANVIDVGVGDLLLGTSGAGTIGGAGTINSTGEIVLRLGTNDVTVGMSAGHITVGEGGSILTIGTTPSALKYFDISSQSNISTTADISIGGASTGTLDFTSNATNGNISLSGNVTANAAIELTVLGAGTVTSTGTLNSVGSIVLNLGTAAVALGAASGNIIVTQGASTLTIASPATLSGHLAISAEGAIATVNDISIGGIASGTLDLAASGGNITLANNLTANGGISLNVSNAATITGPGTVISSAVLTIDSGTSGTSTINSQVGQLTSSTSGASLLISQTGNIKLNTNNEGTGQLSVTVDAGSNINVAAAITANAVMLQTAGAGTIGGTGLVNAYGLNVFFGTGAVSVGTVAGRITVNHGSSILTIGTAPAAIGFLGVKTADDITVANDINIGNSTAGTLRLTSTAGNINLSGNLTAGAGLELIGQMVGGAGTINSTQILSLQLQGSGLVTLGTSGGKITVSEGAYTVTVGTAPSAISNFQIVANDSITLSNDITIGGASTGTLFLTSNGGSINLPNNLTANGGISVNVFGSATIGGPGTLNTSGPMALIYGSGAVTIDEPSTNITVSQGSSTVNIAINTLPSFLHVITNDSIAVAHDINLGSQSLEFQSVNGDISLTSNNLIANGGITLMAGGTISSTTGTISSSTAIALSPGTGMVTVTNSSGIAVKEGGQTILLGSTPTSLVINSQGGITISDALFLPGTSLLSLNTTAGNIALNNGVSAYTVGLIVTGGGTIGGLGIINTNAYVVVSLDSNAVLGTFSNYLTLSEGSNTLFIAPTLFELALHAPTVTISNGTIITAPTILELHTNNLVDNGTIRSSIANGIVEVDNSGFTGSLTLSGNGTATNPTNIQFINGASGQINIFDVNGQAININSSYTFNAGSTGGVRIWEAVTSVPYPNINSTVALFGAHINPTSGQINIANNVTVTGNGSLFVLGASTITIGTTSVSGAVVQTTTTADYAIHTSNLVDNGTITTTVSQPGFTTLVINDEGMNSNVPLTLSGSPQPITNTSNTGGAIAISDKNGQGVYVNSSYTINAGLNCPDVTGIWEASIGGDNAGGSTHTQGEIVLAANVILTITSKAEIKLDAPIQIYNTGSKVIVTGAATAVVIEASNLVNNGSVILQVPGSKLRIGDDDVGEPNAANADVEGPVSISGTGNFGFAAGVAGDILISAVSQGYSKSVTYASLLDPISLSGNLTFNVNSANKIVIEANQSISFAGTTTIQGGGGLYIDSPLVTNNGTISSSGLVDFENALANTAFSVVANNGSVTSSVGGPAIAIQGAGSLAVGGSGIYFASGSNSQINVSADGLDPVTVVGTFSVGAGRLTFTLNNLVNNGIITSSAFSATQSAVLIQIVNDNISNPGAITLSGDSGIINLNSGAAGAIVISDSVGVLINGPLNINAGTGAGSVVQIQTGGEIEIANGAQVSLTGVNANAPLFTANIVTEASGAGSAVFIATQNPTFGSGVTVNIGLGTFGISPISNSQAITVVGTTGAFNITAAFMKLITAGTLEIGSSSSAGGITLAGAITVPTTGSAGITSGYYSFDFEDGGTGGSYNGGTGHAINLQGQNLTVNVAGLLNTGTGVISGTTGTVAISGGAVTVAGAIKLTGSGQVQLNGQGPTFALNAAVSTGTGGGVMLSDSTGTISGTGVITSGTLGVNIGSISAILTTAVNTITVTSANNLTLKNTGHTVTTLNASAVTGTLQITNSVALLVNGTISANSISLSGVGITLSGNLDANTSLIVSAGTGAISETSGTLQAASVALTGGNIGTSGNAILLATPTLTLTAAAGSVFLSDSVSVSLNKSSAKTLQLTDTFAHGTITVAGALTGTNLSLAAASGTNGSIVVNAALGATGSILTLTANGSGTITEGLPAGLITGAQLSLVGGTGDFGSTNSNLITSVASLAVTGGNDNAFITNSIALSLLSSSLGGTFQLTDKAILTTTGVISAPVISLTGNTGLVIKSAVGQATGNTTLATIGAAAMTYMTGGLVNGTNVTLKSVTGSIGKSAAPIKTAADALTLTTGGTGSIYASNASSVTLDASSAGSVLSVTGNGTITTFGALTTLSTTSGTLLLKATGNAGGIVLGAGVGGSKTAVTLTASGAGTITQTSATVTGSAISLITAGGAIGASGGAISTSTAALTLNSAAGNAFVSNSTALKLNASTAAALVLTAGGTITVGGVLSASNVTLQVGSGTNGGIVLGANVGLTTNDTGTKIFNANGTGAITQSTGTVYGGNLQFSSGTGNIGTSTTAIKINDAGTLTSRTSASGGTGVSNFSDVVANLVLDSSVSGGAFTLTATGNLTVNSITTGSGSTHGVSTNSISVFTTGGNLQVNDNAVITANGGNITLDNKSTTVGTIHIGQTANQNDGVILTASSTVAKFGQVNIVIGAVPTANPAPGPNPGNVSIVSTPSTPVNVFFGTKGITTDQSGTIIQLNDTGRNIWFNNAGTTVNTSITVRAGTQITAQNIAYPADGVGVRDSESIIDTGEYEQDSEDDTVARAY